MVDCTFLIFLRILPASNGFLPLYSIWDLGNMLVVLILNRVSKAANESTY
nr:MAG TPA: hypothetical protein [Caudoviricetes sp.]